MASGPSEIIKKSEGLAYEGLSDETADRACKPYETR